MNATDKHYHRKQFAVDPVAEGFLVHGSCRQVKAALDAYLTRNQLSEKFQRREKPGVKGNNRKSKINTKEIDI